ncbi:hypothetical protein GSI_05156 [Ganoderma sinense ZZ0214-1]|uniref:Fungal-type protein kinase domain-containing protein n=1 Tax=Ganoderma sinense ZZ0214-1 TaxID=1077348 RepID=A0A2G8SF92_9APHY|nr:hypothetical protein GSI_05156 [Ganoderma sinense ZZ0214-1]
MTYAAILAEKEEFCQKYFPTPNHPHPGKPRPILDRNPFERLGAFRGSEAELSRQFGEIVNEWNLIPGFVFRECSKRPEPLYVDPHRRRADAAWYFERNVKNEGQQEWGDQVIPVEFKTVDDPFDEKNISASSERHQSARDQCTTYSELIHAVQQRTALFMLIIIGRRARFTRWDRSGTVVTRAFDYVKDWEFFCDVLWRIGNCSEAQLGLDPTATRIYDTDADYLKMFKAANMGSTVNHSERVLEDGQLPVGEFEYVRRMFCDSIKEKWPRYRVEVPSPDGEKTHMFLIGKPVFRAEGMAGRGTRGYVALDCDTGSFVWLKDVWRANHEFFAKEGDILKRLNLAGVHNVPTLVCHGDIEGQATETPDWWEPKKLEREEKAREKAHRQQALEEATRNRATPASSSIGSFDTYVNPSSFPSLKRTLRDSNEVIMEPATDTERCPLRLHQHYRLVVKEVAMPLDKFEYPQQLVAVIFDSVHAHYDAVTEESLLHRDISSGNILIYPRVIEWKGKTALQWRGMLVDWEMSKEVHDRDGLRQAWQTERTGTWQYLSVALLSRGSPRVELPDELESFFHVLLYYALRYVRSANASGLTIANFLESYFDVYGLDRDGRYICGVEKCLTIEMGRIQVVCGTILRFDNPLDRLFANLLSWFRARYIVLAHEQQNSELVDQQPSASTGSDVDPRPPSDAVLDEYGPREDNLKAWLAPPEPFSAVGEIEVSEAERKLAQRLDTHDQMLLLLLSSLRERWPPQRAADQIPATWTPSEKYL